MEGAAASISVSTKPALQLRVVVDAHDFDKTALEHDLQRIVKYEINLMGGPPFREYTFFFHIGPYLQVGGGGMEHSFCTAISASTEPGAASTAAHEFFHAWNVKRIRPQALEPVDYTKEQYTRALWFAEGVTSTYASFTLARSGVWDSTSSMATWPSSCINSIPVPRAFGKAWKIPVWMPG